MSKMKMPDEIYVTKSNWFKRHVKILNPEKYYHSRIVEDLKAENEALKAPVPRLIQSPEVEE